MKISRQDPRAHQKERTRAAIVQAALALLREGETPTIQTVAEAAKVSRATAYRYFPTNESLMSEIVDITPTMQSIEDALPAMRHSDVKEVSEIQSMLNHIVVKNEARYRAAMRFYIDTWFEARKEGDQSPVVRSGRRARYLEVALEPLRNVLPAPDLARLRNALALTMGIESIVILKDICGLTNDEALDVLNWTALALIDAAQREVRSDET